MSKRIKKVLRGREVTSTMGWRAARALVLALTIGLTGVAGADTVATLSKGATQIGEYSTIKAAVDEWNNQQNNGQNGDYTITVKNGTYDETGITFEQRKENCTLRFQAETAGGVTNAPTAKANVFVIDGMGDAKSGNAIVFDGITVDLRADGASDAYAFYFGNNTAGNYARNVTVQNSTLLATSGGTSGAFMSDKVNAFGLLVTNCTITGFKYALSARFQDKSGFEAEYPMPNYCIAFKDSRIAGGSLINNQMSASVLVDGCTVDSTNDYTIRSASGGNPLTVTVVDSTITYTNNKEEGGIFVCRSSDVITITNSTLDRSGSATNYDVYNKSQTPTIKAGSYIFHSDGKKSEPLAADYTVTETGYNFTVTDTPTVIIVDPISGQTNTTIEAIGTTAKSGSEVMIPAGSYEQTLVTNADDSVTLTVGTHSTTFASYYDIAAVSYAGGIQYSVTLTSDEDRNGTRIEADGTTPALNVVTGTGSLEICVPNVQSDLWYATKTSSDFATVDAADSYGWAKGSELLAGACTLTTEPSAGAVQRFSKVVVTDRDPDAE